MRKNIFEVASASRDLLQELQRIRVLFEERTVIDGGFDGYFSILDYVRAKGFSCWKNRGHCVDTDDFLNLFDYTKLWVYALSDESSLLTLLEIVYNFWHIVNQLRVVSPYRDDRRRDFELLRKILDDCLAQYNYKGQYSPQLEQLIVIEDKPEVTAVAEIVDGDTAHRVLRYNHHLMRGNLQAKKDILLALGADVEAKRKKLHAIDSVLEDNIFYILNNLNLRHNNVTEGDRRYKVAVAKMDKQTLEMWYDELYQMLLLAYLQLDQVDRTTRVKELRDVVEGAKA